MSSEFKKRFLRIVSETIESLTDEQEAKFDEALNQNPPNTSIRVNSQKTVFEKFKLVRSNEIERIKFVKALFFKWESLQTPEYVSALKSSREVFKSWGFEQLETITEKQRANFIQNLRERAEELQKISKKILT